MKFTNIKLADGKSGARPDQGLVRSRTHYIAASHYGFNTIDHASTVDTDYYVVWNNWPTMEGSNTTGTSTGTTQYSALTSIGITTLYTSLKAEHASGTLDTVIIRKSDRKAIRLQITGSTDAHYKNINNNHSSTTITEFDAKNNPWTPEIARLHNMGYV